MVKAKAELGLTLKMAAGGGFNFFRPLISLDDIDTDGDVPAQIESGLAALNLMWSAVEGRMVQIVETSELAESESVFIEIKTRIAALEEQFKSGEGVILTPAEELEWKAPNAKKTRKGK